VTRPTLQFATIDLGCLAVRMLLDVLGVGYDRLPVDVYPGGDPGPWPTLVDGTGVITGRTAILRHLAASHDPTGSWVGGPEVDRWLAYADGELAVVDRCRGASLLGPGADLDDRRQARRALIVLEDRLCVLQFSGAEWFAGHGPTIADIALYPEVALSRDIGIEHAEFPALRHWLRRVRGLAPTVSMPGILDPI
jgi:glutathione S-transferase